MTAVTRLISPIYRFWHDGSTICNNVKFAGCDIVFVVYHGFERRGDFGYQGITRVYPREVTDAKYEITLGGGTKNIVWDTLNEMKVESEPQNYASSMMIVLELKSFSTNNLPSSGLYSLKGLESYIGNGPVVTLIGTDGSITVPKRLLKIRCEALLKQMLKHDMKKKQTSIGLKDFDSKSLDAFCDYLKTGKIKNGEDTALSLVLLGDKYDVQDMKKDAEQFILNNMDNFDRNEVLDIFIRFSRNLLLNQLSKK